MGGTGKSFATGRLFWGRVGPDGMLETHTHNQTQGPRRLSKALLLPRLFHPLFGIRLDSNMFQFANYTNVSRPNVDDFSIYPMIFTMSYHNFPSCTIIIINYPMILPSVSSSVYPISSPAKTPSSFRFLTSQRSASALGSW